MTRVALCFAFCLALLATPTLTLRAEEKPADGKPAAAETKPAEKPADKPALKSLEEENWVVTTILNPHRLPILVTVIIFVTLLWLLYSVWTLRNDVNKLLASTGTK